MYRESDAVTVISALLLWLIKSYFDICNSASRASLTKLKESISCSRATTDTAVQIQNIEESFSFPLSLIVETHTGCQIEDTQQDRVQLTVEGDEPYTASWLADLPAF